MSASIQYANVKFPPYAYAEYPKWVTAPGGKAVIAEDRAHEIEIMQSAPEPEPPPPSPKEMALQAEIAALTEMIAQQSDAPDEKTDLIRQAEAKGIIVDKRWGIDRIRSAIALHDGTA